MSEEDNRSVILLLEMSYELNRFYNSVSVMSNCDYDIHELINKCTRALEIFGEIEESFDDVIEYYRLKFRQQESENWEADLDIFEPALRAFFADYRDKLNLFDVYDDAGTLRFIFATLRNDEIVLSEKDIRNITTGEGVIIPYANRPALEDIKQRLNNNTGLRELISPDDGYEYSIPIAIEPQ